MKVLESFIKGKISEDKCEDRLVISNDFIAVVDGVSSKSSYLDKGKTTGNIAAGLIKDVIYNMAKETSLQDFISYVNKAFEDYYKNSNFDLDVNRYGLQAMAVIYSDYEKKIWLIGDCVAVVNDEYYTNPKPSDTVLEELRSLKAHLDLYDSSIAEEVYFDTDEAARKFIEPLIVESTIFANNDNTRWGYSVLNGNEIPTSLCKIIDVEEDNTVILASDGYPHVFKTLNETEENLIRVIEKDPYFYKDFISTKGLKPGQISYDDRTYVKFEV